eukprot:gene5469-3943_t
MHHLRGLLRKPSEKLLRKFEVTVASRKSVPLLKDCFTAARFVDSEGSVTNIQLLRVPSLLQLLDKVPLSDGKEVLREAVKVCSNCKDGHQCGTDPETDEEPALYVKSSASEAGAEAVHRQLQLLYRLEGKLCASHEEEVERISEKILEECKQGIVSQFTSALFRGLLQELSLKDPKAALSLVLAAGDRLPICGAAAPLAELVNLSSDDAICTFFKTFAPMDAVLSASQTAATSLAVRVRKELSGASELGSTCPSKTELIRYCQEYRVDPGTVFPADAYAIQQWASGFFSPEALPCERRKSIIKVVKERNLLPRRTSMNALSVWCGSDLEKEWTAHFLTSESPLVKTVGCKVADISSTIARRSSMALVMKDPQRNLVDNRLLRFYQQCLERGDISAEDRSFSSFMDACGECHEEDELPEVIRFTIAAPLDRLTTVGEALVNLAPRSSYWTSLLQHRPAAIHLHIAPFNEVRVEVYLPRQHECVAVAKDLAEQHLIPPLDIVWEDEELLVISKPPGLATTRHALSCTQASDATLTDMISILLVHRYDSLAPLPRNGLVHRLDSETSGCVVVAKTERAMVSLRHQFGTNASFSLFTKSYVALCVALEENLENIPLSGTLKDPSDPKVVTTYTILRFFAKSRIAVVECQLQQGKKHQVRRHLAAVGLPLVGDVVHGGAACIQACISRTALHAASVSFLHPCHAEVVSFTAPLPSDFLTAFQLLEKMEHLSCAIRIAFVGIEENRIIIFPRYTYCDGGSVNLMNSLSDLEEQIVLLNSLSKVSAKTLDSFADVSHSISVRAHQIFRDVKPWEVALENIEATIEEISKAAKCYHQPPALKAVLTEKDTHPDSIARCMDYLVYTDEYLTSHPPNEYGEIIRAQLDDQLDRIVTVSEKFIRNAFVAALKKPPGEALAPKDGNKIIKNCKALTGVSEVLSRLAQHFNRTEVVVVDTKQLLETRLKNTVSILFSSAPAEDDVRQNSSAVHASGQRHHYHRGDHRLLAISKEARQMVKEVADCIHIHIIRPMDEDFSVVDMPGELATKIFDIVADKARTAIHFDKRVLRDPTSMFLASRGQGVGLYPGARTFQDIIFVGLDIMEDMWGWKQLIHRLPGDNNEAKDHVDEAVDSFAMMVRELLLGYVDAAGGISKELLQERTRQNKRTEWFPALDCTAHESSTNLLYFQKVLFSSFYGAMKLALFGCALDSSSDYQAVKEVEDFFSRCVLGHMEDMLTIGTAAKELLSEMEQNTKSKKRHAHYESLSFISVDVFVINNALFLSQSYMKANCFTRRAIPPVPGSDDKGRHESNPTPVVASAMEYLQDEVDRSVEGFGLEWEKCFPPLPRDITVAPVGGATLKKTQIASVKGWFAVVRSRIAEYTLGCKREAVMDTDVRRKLIRGACDTVERKYEEMTAALQPFVGWGEALQSTLCSSQDSICISFHSDEMLVPLVVVVASFRTRSMGTKASSSGGWSLALWCLAEWPCGCFLTDLLSVAKRNISKSMDKTADIPPDSKWLRAKEIKIDPFLPASTDGKRRFDSRKVFRPKKLTQSAFHVTSTKKNPSFSTSPTQMANVNAKGAGKSGARRGAPSQTILSEDVGQNIWASSVRMARPKNISEGHSVVEPKGSRAPIRGKPPVESPQSLLIEGNSVCSGDIAYASHALDHLTSCVKEERKLREQLDMVKYAKLQAFRSVISMFRSYVQHPSIRTHPEAKTIARCSVVTKTLTTVIQTFLRYTQSRQLVAGMMHHQRMRTLGSPSENDRTAASVFSERAAQSLGSDYDRASRSVEDLLDEQEVNKLKQLYFDYYDCEVVSIGTPELSNASLADPHEVLCIEESRSSSEKETPENNFFELILYLVIKTVLPLTQGHSRDGVLFFCLMSPTSTLRVATVAVYRCLCLIEQPPRSTNADAIYGPKMCILFVCLLLSVFLLLSWVFVLLSFIINLRNLPEFVVGASLHELESIVETRMTSGVSNVTWQPPLVFNQKTLINPFFTTPPLPCVITNSNMKYFFDGLEQLSQLVHYIAINTSFCDQKGNSLLRQYLLFHLEHFLNISFRLPTFLSQLQAVNKHDVEAICFLRFIEVESSCFIKEWNSAVELEFQLRPDELRSGLARLKRRADSISGCVAALQSAHERFLIKRGVWEMLDIFLSMSPMPKAVFYLCVTVCFLTAFLVSLACWVLWMKPLIVLAVVGTVFSVVQLAMMLIALYMVSRRSALMDWYSQELSANLAQSFFSEQLISAEASQLQFHIDCARGPPQRLKVHQRHFCQLLAMIGFTESLKIVAWNTTAQRMTGFTEADVIGESLGLVIDQESAQRIKMYVRDNKEELLQGLVVYFHGSSREKISFTVTITSAFLETAPIFLLIGTALGRTAECSMHYLSNIGTSVLTKKLLSKGFNPQGTVMDIVRSNSWCSLRERGSRNWNLTDMSYLIRQLKDAETLPFNLVVSLSQPIPAFECDTEQVVHALRSLVSTVWCSPGESVLVRFTKINLNWGSFALEVRVDLPERAQLQPYAVLRKYIAHVGFIYAFDENNFVEAIFPIYFPAEAPCDAKCSITTPKTTPDAETEDLLLHFVVFESDLHYSFLVNNFSSEFHRFTRVYSFLDLKNELASNSEKVSAVIVSDTAADFLDLVSEVRRHSARILVAATSTKWSSAEMPFSGGVRGFNDDVDWLLCLPAEEHEWKHFLHRVSASQEERLVRGGYSSAELEWVRDVARGPNSEVVLVRDTVTGGTMVRKTVHVAASEQTVKEIRIMKIIGTHPYILRCLGTTRDSSTHLSILYPYCSGGTLKDRIATEPLTLEQLPVNDALCGGTAAYMPPERLLDIQCQENEHPMLRLFQGDIWSVGLTLLRAVGGYPEEVEHKSVKVMMEIYRRHYLEGSEVSFDVPVAEGSTEKRIFINARHFFTRIMQIVPSRRPSAAELLQHSFITGGTLPHEFLLSYFCYLCLTEIFLTVCHVELVGWSHPNRFCSIYPYLPTEIFILFVSSYYH